MSKFFTDNQIESIQYSNEIIDDFISENEIGRTLSFENNNPSFGEMFYMYLKVAIKKALSDKDNIHEVKRSCLIYNRIDNAVHRATISFNEVDLYNSDLFNKIFNLLDARSTIDRYEFEKLICDHKDWMDINKHNKPDFDIFNPIDVRYELIRHMLKNIIMDARQMFIKNSTLKQVRIGSPYESTGYDNISINIQRYNIGNNIYIGIGYNM